MMARLCPYCLQRPMVADGLAPPVLCLPCREHILDRLRHAATRKRKDHWTREHYWSAVWWRLNSRLGAHPGQGLVYAANMFRLHRDMLARTDHYRRVPPGLSYWQWMQK